jgi:urease accessory protein
MADGAEATVALVATRALLLAGDEVRVEIQVGPGARLRLIDVSGTVCYNARGGRARWEISAWVAAGARLSWLAEPLVLADGADLVRRTDVCLGVGAWALWRETTVIGRSGEAGGRLDATTRVVGPDGPILTERLALDGSHRLPGILAGVKVVDQAVLAGRRPTASVTTVPVYSLELPGAVARLTGPATHLADIGDVMAAWDEDITST